jgi:hypothetical protein
MVNNSKSKLHVALVLGLFIASTLVFRTEGMQAQTERAVDGVQSSARLEPTVTGLRSEGSLLIAVNRFTGENKVVGLAGRLPKSVERLSPQRTNKERFALVVTGDGSTFIKPLLVRDVDPLSIEVLLPFSREWQASEILLIGLPTEPQPNQTFRGVTLSGAALTQVYSDLLSARSEGAGVRPMAIHCETSCFPVSGGSCICFNCCQGTFTPEYCSEPYRSICP